MRKICVLRWLTNPAGESQSEPQGHSRLSPNPTGPNCRGGTDTEEQVYKTPPLFVFRGSDLERLLSPAPAGVK